MRIFVDFHFSAENSKSMVNSFTRAETANIKGHNRASVVLNYIIVRIA